MKKPLATLTAILVMSTLMMGFAAGPVAAQDCTNTASSTSVSGVSAVNVNQYSTQIQTGSIVQTGVAVSLDGDATVVNSGNLDQDQDSDNCANT